MFNIISADLYKLKKKQSIIMDNIGVVRNYFVRKYFSTKWRWDNDFDVRYYEL